MGSRGRHHACPAHPAWAWAPRWVDRRRGTHARGGRLVLGSPHLSCQLSRAASAVWNPPGPPLPPARPAAHNGPPVPRSPGAAGPGLGGGHLGSGGRAGPPPCSSLSLSFPPSRFLRLMADLQGDPRPRGEVAVGDPLCTVWGSGRVLGLGLARSECSAGRRGQPRGVCAREGGRPAELGGGWGWGWG